MWAGLIYIKLLYCLLLPHFAKRSARWFAPWYNVEVSSAIIHRCHARRHKKDDIRENNQGAMVRLEVRMSITNIELNSKVTF